MKLKNTKRTTLFRISVMASLACLAGVLTLDLVNERDSKSHINQSKLAVEGQAELYAQGLKARSEELKKALLDANVNAAARAKLSEMGVEWRAEFKKLGNRYEWDPENSSLSTEGPSSATGPRAALERKFQSSPQWSASLEHGLVVFDLLEFKDNGATKSALVAGIAAREDVYRTRWVMLDAQTFFKHLTTGEGFQSMVLNQDGLVLYHSDSALIGAQLGAQTIFKDLAGVRGLGSIKSVLTKSVQGEPIVAAFSRPDESWSWGVVVQRSTSFHDSPETIDSTGPQSTIFKFASVFFALCALFLWVKFSKFNKESKRDSSPLFSESDPVPHVFVPPVEHRFETKEAVAQPSVPKVVEVIAEPAVAKALEQVPVFDAGPAMAELQAEKQALEFSLRQLREENAVIQRFENEALMLKDPRVIAFKMVRAVHDLSGSPALYFNYHPNLRSATLLADAGFSAGQAPIGIGFTLNDEALNRVIESLRTGELANLSDYPPLAKVILARTGVAHFEAYAITGFGHLGRLSGRARLLGVLVILQSGVDSIAKRESFERMMRSTGLIYENAILATQS